MAREVIVKQSTKEERVYALDFSPALLSGVNVVSVALLYTGDNAEDNDPTMDNVIDGNIAYVFVSNLEIGENHKVSCVATTDNVDLSPEIVLLIKVNW